MTVSWSFDDITPRDEIALRIQRLQAKLQKHQIEGALILQNSDLFYFAGTIQQSHLYIPAEGAPLLMVRKSFERARMESGIPHIVPLSGTGQIATLLTDNGFTIPETLGLELDVIPAQTYLQLTQLLPQTRMIGVSHLIREVRAIKSSYEIDIMREAARCSDTVFACVPQILREGMTEIELAGQIEAHARKLGHQGVVRMRLWGNELFYGHLMCGASAAVPSYLASPTGGAGISPSIAQGPGSNRIERHEPVLVDYVFVCKGYLSDQTRIFSIGRISDDLIEAHMAMLELQTIIKEKAKPGVSAGQVYALALQWVEDAGYAEYFMGSGNQRIRFIGHGIGLELDEYPFLAAGQKTLLEKNMVIALEPKLVFPGRGVVGIENTHIVTADGLTPLTRYREDIIETPVHL